MEHAGGGGRFKSYIGIALCNSPPLLSSMPLQKRGLLFLTKRLPRKRNQNWRTFDNFQKVIICESQ